MAAFTLTAPQALGAGRAAAAGKLAADLEDSTELTAKASTVSQRNMAGALKSTCLAGYGLSMIPPVVATELRKLKQRHMCEQDP